MRGDDVTRAPLLRRHAIRADAVGCVRADVSDYIARFVENRHAAVQFADDRVVAVDRNRGRQQQVVVDDAQERALERQMHDAVVQPVRRDDARGIEARVHRDLVQDVEAVGRGLAAERAEIAAARIEMVDVVARVAIGDVQIAVRRHIHARQQHAELRREAIRNPVLARDRVARDLEHDIAAERHLDELLAAQAHSIYMLAVPGIADHEAVQVGRGIPQAPKIAAVG